MRCLQVGCLLSTLLLPGFTRNVFAAATSDFRQATVVADALTPAEQSLLGEYGPYRANNDLLHYTLTVRADPETGTLRGDNEVRFRMLEDGTRIQLDLAR